MSTMTQLPNIGPKLEEQLAQVGITTPGELKAAGSREAWLRIKAIDPSACIMRLYALEGAVQGIIDRNLDAGVKAELKSFYQRFK
ncbi:MAG: TfoX/Sxy family protein [Christensenellales bacterium]